MFKKTAAVLCVLVLLAACGGKEPKTEESSQKLSKMNTGNYQEQLRTDVSSPPSGKNDYFHWGSIAVRETKKKYPDAQVKDYGYEGRDVNKDGSVIDSFNFNIMENNTKRVVRTSVLHEPGSSKALDVLFEEQG
ncbi:DUF3889 domain-containing protein [Fictibacillus iocasae]|uniref:DUF3889 domain-containing protein n=1 Tax=Fictibacillus iocasae TaxID=2715437 RepID=A0ABW2NQ37_9BACL